MMKRIISLVLCLIFVGTAFVGCNDSDGVRGQSNLSEDKGAYINMYLTDMVYDLDPANAYANESALKLISLLYENLFYVDKNGNLKKELATKYEIIEDKKTNEYKMVITLDGGTWSDGIAVTANDVVYAWRRVLDPENSSAAAALLFDIKNARAVKTGVYEGEQAISIDDVGISSLNEKEVEIVFEGPIDYQQFLRNISCYALVPLREEVVLRNGADWAKKPATIVTSGPFKLRVARYDEEIKNDELRLKETARRAKAAGFDYFCTTLSISPLKNAEKLNEIGQRLASEYGVKYLPSDFKKKNGYKRSVEISREYGMYRQEYCGCVFSVRDTKKETESHI